MSEKCIIYRPLKHQKRLKQLREVRAKLSVDTRMLKTLTSPLRLILISTFVFLLFLFRILDRVFFLKCSAKRVRLLCCIGCCPYSLQ